jgi:DNA-binding transcriptional regulator YiaG
MDPAGRSKMIRVARIVCWHFNGPYPADGIKYQAVHIDHNKANNNYWNLEWQTPELAAAARGVMWGKQETEKRSLLGLYTNNANARGTRKERVFNYERLQALREASGQGLRTVSAYVGVPLATYRDWEAGLAVPRPGNIQKLADSLGVEPADLLD